MHATRSKTQPTQPTIVVTCALCSCMFAQNALKEHMKQKHSDEIFECTECSQFFREEAMLISHLDELHPPLFGREDNGRKIKKINSPKAKVRGAMKPPEVCPLCDCPVTNRSALRSHLASHFMTKTYACEDCSGEFVLKADLMKHKQMTHGCRVSEECHFQTTSGLDDAEEAASSPLKLSKPSGSVVRNSSIASKPSDCTLTSARGSYQIKDNNSRSSINRSQIERSSTDAGRPALDKPSTSTPATCSICKQVLPNVEALNGHRARDHGLPPMRIRSMALIGRELSQSSKPSIINVSQSLSPLESSDVDEETPKNEVELDENTITVNHIVVKMESDRSALNEEEDEYCEDNGVENEDGVGADVSNHSDSKSRKRLYDYSQQNNMDPEMNIQGRVEQTFVYKCSQCTLFFSTTGELTDHLLEHMEKDCILCGRSFESGDELSVHMKLEHNSVPQEIQCDQCPAICTDETTLRRHRLSHVNVEGHKLWRDYCAPCDVYYENRDEHEASEPHKFSRKDCPHCGATMKSSYGLAAHIVKVHGEDVARIFQCDVCGHSFKNRYALKSHSYIHKYKDRFKCDVCNRAFSRKNQLKTHMLVHTREAKFKCEECGKNFIHQNTFKRHCLRHRGVKCIGIEPQKVDLLCETCGKKFFTKRAYITHAKLHEISDLRYKCDLCERSYKTLNYLKSHKRVVHLETERFRCEICQRAFSVRRRLIEHIRVHTKEKPFICETCGFACTTKTHLTRHRRRHTGERPYTCYECGKKFGHISSFKAHQFLHTGERPYTCSYCKKMFFQSVNAHRHLSVHVKKGISAEVLENKGEVEYSCASCWKTFTSQATLRVHAQLVHKDANEGLFSFVDDTLTEQSLDNATATLVIEGGS